MVERSSKVGTIGISSQCCSRSGHTPSRIPGLLLSSHLVPSEKRQAQSGLPLEANNLATTSSLYLPKPPSSRSISSNVLAGLPRLSCVPLVIKSYHYAPKGIPHRHISRRRGATLVLRAQHD